MTQYYQVAVYTPFNQSLLTYSSQEEYKPGELVEVPLGRRKEKGCVLRTFSGEELKRVDLDLAKIKPIKDRLSDAIRLNEHQLQFFLWISKYYHYPVGLLIFDSLPKILKRPRKLKFREGRGEDLNFRFSEEQQLTFDTLNKRLGTGFSKALMHGVTGSGKTIVYLALIKEILSQGKSALFLLPEINLTPQFLETFEKYLDAPIYSYHSSLSQSDKFGLWNLLQEDDKPKVVIGVRSSLFLPVQNLGIIIVDEEHDQSFKQDDRCPYHARDLAIKRAQLLEAPVVLGSATPSLETYKTFKDSGDYFPLKQRVGEGRLPDIKLLDMRDKEKVPQETWPFHEESLKLIQEAFEKGEQVLVFINKLGYANFLQCRHCGHRFECPNCHTNLRVHKHRAQVQCHICDYKDHLPDICPVCGNMNLLHQGFGTEKICEILRGHFPEKNVERFDRDEITTPTKLEQALGKFHKGEIDIFVGTQMLSKGHNFEKVNLVLILGVDSQLNFPDFRANERVYQTLTQVSGRAGRFGGESEVVVQTLGPENEIFQYVKDHSFDDFYQNEILIREACQCPPFKKVVMVYVTANTREKVSRESMNIRKVVLGLQEQHFKDVELHGPRPAFIEKKVNKFTWSLMFRSENLNSLHNFISSLQRNIRLGSGVALKIDVDPQFID